MAALRHLGLLGLLAAAVGCVGGPSATSEDAASTGGDPGTGPIDGGDDSSAGLSGDGVDGASDEGGALAECGNGLVEPGEHCDGIRAGCPASCRYPEGTEIWIRSLGAGAKALSAPGASTTDRLLVQDQEHVYAARLQLDSTDDPIVTLDALTKSDGESAWQYVVENPGEAVNCMDCTPTMAAVTGLVSIQDQICFAGQVRGATGPRGLVACVDATGAESFRYLMPEAEWGESSVSALATSESGVLRAAVSSDAAEHPNTLLSIGLDGAVIDELGLELEPPERVGGLVMPADAQLVLSTRARVQSRAPLATVGWNVMVESARFGHLVSRSGSILAIGTQPGADGDLVLAASSFELQTGTQAVLTGGVGDLAVKYVSDVAVAPNGRAFATVTSLDGEETSVVAIELDGSSGIVWSGLGESGGVAAGADGFLHVLGDDRGPYETWVRQIAIAIE